MLKNGKPYCGAIYAPALGELVYCDTEQAFWIKNNTKIELKPSELGKLPIIFSLGRYVRQSDNYEPRYLQAGYNSMTTHFLYMATGRGRCNYFKWHIWDMGGAWAIMKFLGFEFMDFKTGKILENLSADKFNDKLKIKNVHIVCKPADFEFFKGIAEETGI